MNTLISFAVTLAVIAAIAAAFYFLKGRVKGSRTILFNRIMAVMAGVVPIAVQVTELVDLTQYFGAQQAGFAVITLTILNEIFRRDTDGPVRE